MAEEHRCQAQQLCVNNCGFFGSPTTQNLCSKCYRDLQLKEQQQLALNQTLISSSSSSSSSRLFSFQIPAPSPQVERVVETKREEEKEVSASALPTTQANKCLTCRKRVGLTGFKCRCGMTFCGTHRYPEKHACGFDFKEMGKEQIAKANPVIKGEKLQRI